MKGNKNQFNYYYAKRLSVDAGMVVSIGSPLTPGISSVGYVVVELVPGAEYTLDVIVLEVFIMGIVCGFSSFSSAL